MMIEAMDDLLLHWAKRSAGGFCTGPVTSTPLASAIQYGGVVPRSTGATPSGEFDDLSWDVECAIKRLPEGLRAIATYHYLYDLSDYGAPHMGMSRSGYYARLHRLHVALREELRRVARESRGAVSR